MWTAQLRGSGPRGPESGQTGGEAREQEPCDTMVFGETQLEHLVNLWGADHVVIGTDYPYDMGYYKPVDFVKGAKLTREQKERIIGGNAAKLLGLKRRVGGA